MPKKSGRRTGDDRGRRFTRAAARLTRWSGRPARAAASALLWLSDTLDWLNLWHPDGGEPADTAPQETEINHLSPRP